MKRATRRSPTCQTVLFSTLFSLSFAGLYKVMAGTLLHYAALAGQLHSDAPG
ncbi:hypothetical protein BDV25DRAFT_164138, partial [Aspergillus avenaceus]